MRERDRGSGLFYNPDQEEWKRDFNQAARLGNIAAHHYFLNQFNQPDFYTHPPYNRSYLIYQRFIGNFEDISVLTGIAGSQHVDHANAHPIASFGGGDGLPYRIQTVEPV